MYTRVHDRARADRFRFLTGGRLLAYASAVATVLATTAMAFVAGRFISHASLSLIFVAGVLIVSARTGLGPSLLASVLSFLTLNFFFTQPYYTFAVADESDVAALVVFLLVAAITGNLAARMRSEIDARRASLQRITGLYEFSRRMSSTTGDGEVLEALAGHLAESIHRSVRVFVRLPEGNLELRATAGPPAELDDKQFEDAWSRVSTQPVVVDSWYFLALVSDRKPMGMAAIHGSPLQKDEIDLAGNLCDQAAIALNRTQLVADLEEANVTTETERLRSALLSSVSHDLRTPLASIIGSTTSLLEYGDSFAGEDRRELLSNVIDEGKRLDRHIQNLLDMTRLGQGRLSLRRDWVELHDIVSGAVGRVRDALKDRRITAEIPADMPLLWVHGALIEQALVNVLDNAVSFSPPGGRISITAVRCGEQVELDLCDEGPGIPLEERRKVFEMFHTRPGREGGDRQGTGLGLAICRGIIAAHDGDIAVHGREPENGTCIHIALPLGHPEKRLQR